MRAYGPGKGCGRLSLVMLLFLAGCGGGGGGGGGAALQPLVYSGNTSQASVTTLNASRLAANLFGSSDAASIITGTSIEGGGSERATSGGLTGVARTLNHATRRALANRPRRAPASGVAVPFDETVSCEFGMGTVRTSGTVDDITFTGTITITFSNCLTAGLTLNGTIQGQVLGFDPSECNGDGLLTNFTATTSRITLRGNGVSIDSGGSLQVVTNVISSPTGTETVTNNLINLNNLTGVMTKAETLVSTGNLDFVCTPTSISNLMFTSGQIFDNVHGFVDVSTPVGLQFTVPQPFPTAGEIRLAGNGTALHVIALSSTMVQLQPDADGNGTPDGFMARMNWTELSGPIGADIGNSDTDLMHNSWETFYGMNPTVPGDDVANNDANGGDNLTEYQNGTNPNVAGM